jgi:hypothetical protein
MDKYCTENKIVCGGLLILNIMFDKVRQYGTKYPFEIYTDTPYYTGVLLSNYLAENKVDVTLKTVVIHRELQILYNVYAHPIVTIYKLNTSDTIKMENGFTILSYELQLASICNKLSDLSYSNIWDNLLRYKEQLLTLIKYDSVNIYNPPLDKTLHDTAMEILTKYSDKSLATGKLAYSLLNNESIGSIEFCTEVPLTLLQGLFHQQTNIQKLKVNAEIRLECLQAKVSGGLVKIYNTPSYSPTYIYKNIDKINIADINLIIYLLSVDFQYLCSAPFMTDNLKNTLQKQVDTMMKYFTSINDCTPTTDNNDYIGNYEPLHYYKRQLILKGGLTLSFYHPFSYFETNGHFKDPNPTEG